MQQLEFATSTLCIALGSTDNWINADNKCYDAFRTGRTIRALATERGILPEAELTRLLDARRMTGGGSARQP